LSIEEVVWQLLATFTSNRQSTITNRQFPPSSAKRRPQKFFAKNEEVSNECYSAACGRNQKQILRYAALRSPETQRITRFH
jgi:hypothetical protein